ARVWGLTQTGRRQEAASLKSTANGALKRLPPAGFPAVAHAALTDPNRPEPLKRLRLITASLVGRI
ncbi:squalene/phytoene synthase, partial [Stenotrophomonas maltophilia]